MALLMIFDGSKKPPEFESVSCADTVQEAVQTADDLVKIHPTKLYEVYDNVGVLAYRR